MDVLDVEFVALMACARLWSRVSSNSSFRSSAVS
jgi:hypothetical protein